MKKHHLRLLFSLFILFLLHRTLSFSDLTTQWKLTYQSFLTLLVGALSDYWVSVLAMLLFLVSCAFFSFFTRKISPRLLCGCFFVFFAMVTTLHQAYVEFYRLQFVPEHLKYVLDYNFILSNGQSAFTVKSLLLFLASLVLTYLLFKEVPDESLLFKKSYLPALAISLIGVAAHAINIPYRERLLIQPELRMNFLESFVVNLKRFKVLSPELDGEFALLKAAYPRAYVEKSARLLGSNLVQDLDSDGLAIVQSYRRVLSEGSSPIVIVVALESMRPVESSLYNVGLESSLTPRLDRIFREESIWFNHAYSSGSVTRAGMEALWCGGYPSSLHNSLMRERRDIKIKCLPQQLNSENERSFWFHGGKGAFDNQLEFWKSQFVQDLFTFEDADSKAPFSSWGLSDKYVFRKSLEYLVNGDSANAVRKSQFGMVLTMTNHIPWQLPEDAASLPSGHDRFPWYDTTLYTDEALGDFFEGLKKSDLWDRSLVFVVSDHGMSTGLSDGVYKLNSRAHHQSHIFMGITGGLLPENIRSPKPRKEFVSQQHLGSFLYTLLDKEAQVFNLPLFSKTLPTPVAWLEKEFFIPEHELILEFDKVFDVKDVSGLRPEIAHLRHQLRLIDEDAKPLK